LLIEGPGALRSTGSDVAPTVIVTRAGLRRGLLELLALESQATAHAGPLSGEVRDVRRMRTHHLKAKALGDLLEEIGWEEGDLVSSCELDIGRHGWAATVALDFLVERERLTALDFAMEEEAEASGEAGGHRVAAERELALIEAACEQAGLAITEPEP
jgi:hypothetical protein